ncbi:MAG: RHS repeat-associated core domain-containing protein [Chthonomonadaceae bacterium]|nr:RHS repeat-associated core domain-containing protein [Chthonomonadaceae bacterium]
MKLFRDTRITRPLSTLVVFGLISWYVPVQALADGIANARAEAAKRPKMAESRTLSPNEMQRIKGRIAPGNPYYAGNLPYDPQFKGVNMRTGNFSLSATDLSFEGGYGIPVSIVRTYSSNNIDEGPFGVGWSWSLDLRTSAGGFLKSESGQSHVTPTQYRERPSTEIDPNVKTGPVEAVVATDAGGQTETLQRDADGILTGPAWDLNRHEPVYQYINGVRSMVSISTYTPEGSVYKYIKTGTYTGGGAKTWYNQYATAEPSDVWGIDTVTDRHGQQTKYNYSSSDQNLFLMANGMTSVKVVTSVDMPGGRTIAVTWTTPVDGHTRVASVGFRPTSGTSVVTQSVTSYGYDSNGQLTSVNSPTASGTSKTTTFGYGNAYNMDGSTNTDRAFLTSVTDMRGLTSQIKYAVMDDGLFNDNEGVKHLVGVTNLTAPNGVKSYFWRRWLPFPTGQGPTFSVPTDPHLANSIVMEQDGGSLIQTTAYQFVSSVAVGGATGNDHIFAPHSGLMSYATSAVGSSVLISSTTNEKTIEPETMRVLTETSQISPAIGTITSSTKSSTTTNGMGKPLSQKVEEFEGNSTTASRTFLTEYAYHGRNKYYQQKAVRTDKDPGSTTSWRYSYTDYYADDDTSSSAAKGMTKAVYDNKYGAITVVEDATHPWRKNVSIGSSGLPMAQFQYDYGTGRVTKVSKRGANWNGTNASDWVDTTTTYNDTADGSATAGYGAASQVVEDAGSGRLNRTTTTNEWHWSGKASKTTDGAGRQFTTVYDDSNLVKEVKKTSVTPNVSLVENIYGTSGVTNGQLTQTDDKVSGTRLVYQYESNTGGGIGQVKQAKQTRTGPSAINVDGTMDYTYNSTGDRATAVHTTPFNKVKWEYSDYVTLGTADSPKRVFTVMQRHSDGGNNTWNLTNDRFRYSFDVAGRMLWARFAPTPQSGKTVADADPWASFVQADYSYDAGGRTLSIGYAKNVLDTNGTSYTVTNLRGYEAVYASQLALKSQTKTFNGNGTGWTEDTAKAQSYGYDSDYDYLTSANYNGSADTWTYDPAGNRKSYNGNTGFVYDNLNRMTASVEKNTGGSFLSHTFSYNSGVGLLGFRWYRDYANQAAVRKTDWNDLGQMSACRGSTYGGSTVGSKYEYLPGGMRVTKVDGIVMDAQLDDQGNVSGYYDVIGGTNKPTTRYYYDGQMPVAEDFTRLVSGVTKVDKDWYGLGARGIDWQQHYDAVADVTSVGFPLYDTHGNNVASLSRTGSNDFTVSNERTYDAWGAIRSGANYPQQGYCASLGHRQDDESGLVYMRARYYEPSTGRFVSQDPGRDGGNWFTYCGSNPIDNSDFNGKYATLDRNLQRLLTTFFAGLGVACLAEGMYGLYVANPADPVEIMVSADLISKGLLFLTLAYAAACTSNWHTSFAVAAIGVMLDKFVKTSAIGVAVGSKSNASPAVWAVFAYSCLVMVEIASLTLEEG